MYSYMPNRLSLSIKGVFPLTYLTISQFSPSCTVIPLQAVELEPRNARAFLVKGTILQEMKQFSPAVAAFRDAYALSKGFQAFQGTYGHVYWCAWLPCVPFRSIPLRQRLTQETRAFLDSRVCPCVLFCVCL